MRNASGRLFGAVGLVALVAVAAACVPAAPDPPPTSAAPPATTAAPPPNPCQEAPAQSGATGTDYVLVTRRDGKIEVHRFHANSEAEKDQQTAEAAQGGDVLAVEPDQAVQASDPPVVTDTLATPADQWGVFRSHFDAAWATDEGTDVRIAIVDSGVQGDHEDLAGQVVAGKDFVTPGVTDGMSDFYGHGTHVAGIAAAALNGVGGAGGAPAAKIVSARVLNCSGSGSIYNVELGIVWAAKPVVDGGGGAQVINLSLGAYVDSPSLDAVIDGVESQGVVVVSAAGNCGTTDPTANSSFCPPLNPGEPAGYPKPLYPAASGHTIAVGATDPGDGRAFFSNSGPYVDLAAPGQFILSSCPPALGETKCPTSGHPGYSLKSGTSMATPFVSASAALLAAACPSSTRDATWVQFVKTQLENTAEDFPTSPVGRDDEFGFGLVRPDRAIDPLTLTCPT